MVPVLAAWMPGRIGAFMEFCLREEVELDILWGYCVHSPDLHGFS